MLLSQLQLLLLLPLTQFLLLQPLTLQPQPLLLLMPPLQQHLQLMQLPLQLLLQLKKRSSNLLFSDKRLFIQSFVTHKKASLMLAFLLASRLCQRSSSSSNFTMFCAVAEASAWPWASSTDTVVTLPSLRSTMRSLTGAFSALPPSRRPKKPGF